MAIKFNWAIGQLSIIGYYSYYWPISYYRLLQLFPGIIGLIPPDMGLITPNQTIRPLYPKACLIFIIVVAAIGDGASGAARRGANAPRRGGLRPRRYEVCRAYRRGGLGVRRLRRPETTRSGGAACGGRSANCVAGPCALALGT